MHDVPGPRAPLGTPPDGWTVARIADFAIKVGSGATPRGGQASYLPNRETFALVRSQNVLDRQFSGSSIAFIADAAAAKLKNVHLQAGDVLLNITGDGVTFGRACVVPEEILPACVNQHVSIIRVRRDACVPGYLLSYLVHPGVKQYIESFDTGGSRRAVTKADIESFAVPLPPLPTQRRIAGILSAYDDLIENNTKRIKILEEMAWALFHRSKGEGAGDSIKRELGEISDEVGGTIRTGPFGTALHKHDYTDEGTPVVMPKDLIDGRVSEATIARVPAEIVERLAQHVLHEGDIVYGRRGDIGRRGYIGARNAGWLCGTGCLRISLPPGVLSTRYLHEYLGQPEVIALIAGRAVGSTMPNLNTKILRSIPVEVPPVEIQREFDDGVRPIDGLRDNLLEQLDNLRETRDLLLPRLISGEIDVDALDLPEAAQ